MAYLVSDIIIFFYRTAIFKSISRSIVCFCIKWQQLKYIEKKTSPTAIVRFLTDTCGIECASDEIAVSAHIGRLLKVDYDKEVFFDVCDYFN